jgi:3-dehydroquinate synthase
VIIDISFVQTLGSRHFNNGLAEIIKYGAVLDTDLFTLLERNIDKIKRRDPALLARIIMRCVAVKSGIIEQDEREETGLRLVLNFGHTIGHAIERASRYRIDHGAAVAIGMVEEAQIAVRLGFLSAGAQRRLKKLISSFGLQTDLSKTDEICEYIKQDKKMHKTKLPLPIMTGIGKVRIKELKWEKLL